MTTRIESELIHSSLFHDLSRNELAEVVRVAHEREVGRDEYFFHEGDPAHVLYILTQGQARLVQVTPEGSQVILKFIAAGDMFGGVAFLGEAAYPASAQAVEDSAAATWDGETIAHLMEQHPRIAMNALHHLAQRVQELQDRVRELATQRVERRIANTLVRLAQQSGQSTPEGVLIDMPLSRQDLAELTGTTLYTVSRVLSRWEQEGLVESGRERILIRSTHGLVTIAQDLPEPPSVSKKPQK